LPGAGWIRSGGRPVATGWRRALSRGRLPGRVRAAGAAATAGPDRLRAAQVRGRAQRKGRQRASRDRGGAYTRLSGGFVRTDSGETVLPFLLVLVDTADRFRTRRHHAS